MTHVERRRDVRRRDDNDVRLATVPEYGVGGHVEVSSLLPRLVPGRLDRGGIEPRCELLSHVMLRLDMATESTAATGEMDTRASAG